MLKTKGLHTETNAHNDTHTHTQTHRHTDTQTHTHTHTHTQKCIFVHLHIPHRHARVHAHTAYLGSASMCQAKYSPACGALATIGDTSGPSTASGKRVIIYSGYSCASRVCIHACVGECVHICIHACVRYVCVCVQGRSYRIHTYDRTYIQTKMQARMHIHMHTYKPVSYTHLRAHET